MLRAEDNRFLTESEAGTPMGALLRRLCRPAGPARGGVMELPRENDAYTDTSSPTPTMMSAMPDSSRTESGCLKE